MRVGLLVLIGLPGSGKTTLAKNLTRFGQLNRNIYNFIHVCYDDLIHFPNETEWKSARNSVLIKIEKLIQAVKNKNITDFGEFLKSDKHWESDFVLIIDDNMYFKSMRYSLFQIAKKYSIGFCQVYLNCTIEKAIINNGLKAPEIAVPSDVIMNMSAKIEPPNHKNNWEKYSIEFNEFCDFDDIQYKLFPVLNTSLNNYFYERDKDDDINKELSKIQCKKSVLHQSDIALRRIVSCKIKKYLNKNTKEKSKDFIKELNIRKSELLFDIKVGNICLPDEVLEEINSDVLEKFQLINFLDSYF